MLSQLGRYSIEEPTGRGGLGALYRARQPALERTVALEVIDPELRERAEREARILGSIEHPGLPGVFEAGEEDGHLSPTSTGWCTAPSGRRTSWSRRGTTRT